MGCPANDENTLNVARQPEITAFTACESLQFKKHAIRDEWDNWKRKRRFQKNAVLGGISQPKEALILCLSLSRFHERRTGAMFI
jgi:hypothetical protein